MKHITKQKSSNSCFTCGCVLFRDVLGFATFTHKTVSPNVHKCGLCDSHCYMKGS